ICAPMRARERPIGAITVARTATGEAYGADDLALVQDIAARIAVAIDRARLFAEVEQRADAARVLEHVADGSRLLDRSGNVRLWNPAAEGITAIRAADIIGRAAVDAIHGWQDAVETVPVAATPDPGHPEVIIPIETERGERWIAISGVQFFGGTVYAFRDLTDVRRLEELKASFIATASHELRTPLAAAYGAAQPLPRPDFALDEGGRERLGPPADAQGRCCDACVRVDPHMPGGVGATGLGLYICNELVGRMGGHIWLESKPGEGSTFLFELPAASSIATARPTELGSRS